jgi:hypothetical protein
MTAQEKQELAHLYDKIVEWRREDSDRILGVKDEIIGELHTAIANHRTNCMDTHLGPMGEKVNWLYDNAQKRCAEAQQRKRWSKYVYTLIGAVCALAGAATPIIIYLF